MAKIIRQFNMDFGDIAADGGSRSFTITGDAGAIFSLEIKNEDDYYYNFKTNTFSATKAKLKQQAISGNGDYTSSITFPSVTDNDHYDIYLWAESAYDTEHAPVSEVRFGDDTLDINSTIGSNSNLVQKIIYQYTDTTITIIPFMNVGGGNAVNWINSYVADTVVIGRGKSVKTSFSCTVQAPTTKAMQILRQPQAGDFFKEINVQYKRLTPAVADTNPYLIQGEDIWAEAASREESNGATGGQTRLATTLNGAIETSNRLVLSHNVVTSKVQVGDRVTGYLQATSGAKVSCSGGTSASDTEITLVTHVNPDGDNVNEIQVDRNLTIDDEFSIFFSAPYYKRFATDASLGGTGILGLKSGHKMSEGYSETNPDVLASAGGSMPGTIAPYEDSTTYTVENINENGVLTETTRKNINISYPAIDTTGFKPTITNGKITAQDGVITFSEPHKLDLAVQGLMGYTDFVERGLDWTKSIHDTEIRVTNLKVELTKPTTTTTSGVSNSTTIPVADREGTIQNVSTVSGIGIAAGAANPTVASATADGSGSWTLSAAQTLESGITLTVENTSRNATITGDIEIISCGDANFNLILDVPSFMTGA
jgi:hypothetical protein